MKETIIVAVSAGPDSMALLQMLHQQNYNIVVAHVNYHQRKTSTRDESCAFEYAKELNVIFEKKDFDIEVKGNFQSVAREFRYNFFKELYDKYQATALYLGHHQDDDLETFLMQQESNRETSYPGIQETVQMKGMIVKRPLLKMSKDAILEYCHQNSVPYEIDESNLTQDYTRNRVRHEIKQLSQDQKNKKIIMLYKAKEEKEKHKDLVPIFKNPFLIQDYEKSDLKLRMDALRTWLSDTGINTSHFSKEYLQELDRQIMNGKAQIPIQNKTLSISFGEVMLHGDLSFSYQIFNSNPHTTKDYAIRKTGETIEGITLQITDYPLTVRSPNKGDKIELRMGTKRLNRFFIDRKIPIHQRASWPVVENCMKEIVFVVGIGCDIHHYSNNPSIFMLKL